MYKLKREVALTFHYGNAMSSDLKLPKGLRCKKIDRGTIAGKFWIDEFPSEIFPRNSILLHNAIHYGVVVEAANVEEIK